MRMKEDHDGAEPSPSSTAAANLIRLAGLMTYYQPPAAAAAAAAAAPAGPDDTPAGEASSAGTAGGGGSGGGGAGEAWLARAQRCFVGFDATLSQAPAQLTQMVAAALLSTRVPLRQVGLGFCLGVFGGMGSEADGCTHYACTRWPPGHHRYALSAVCPSNVSCALSLSLRPTSLTSPHLPHLWAPFTPQVIIAGSLADPATQALMDAVHTPFTPDKVVIHIEPPTEGQQQQGQQGGSSSSSSLDFWQAANPEAASMVKAHWERQAQLGNAAPYTPTAFVCQNFTCQAPTTDAGAVVRLLRQAGGGSGGARAQPTAVPFKL